jgi:signal transduction histidine kinase
VSSRAVEKPVHDRPTESDAPDPVAVGVGPSGFERWWATFERWGGLWLLGLSALLVVPEPGLTARERLVAVSLVAAAALWIVAFERLGPQRWRSRPGFQLLHLAGVLAFATALMLEHVTFFVFAITGFLQAGRLRSKALVYLGVAATSLVINLIMWGGLPAPTMEETGGFLVLSMIQTLLIGSALIGGQRLTELSEERGRTVQRLEAAMAENEGLQAQLVLQAREAGIRDERQRLAREIHDTIAQGLTGIITQLQAASAAARDQSELRRHHDIALALARDSLAEARRSVRALGPQALERGRLGDAIDELAAAWSQRTGIHLTLDLDEASTDLPAPVEVGLLRILQEALANVEKHADAHRAGVTVSRFDHEVVLDVRDDGCGFAPASVHNADQRFGLASMRHRAAELGGVLAVESHPGAGTAISATVPLQLTDPRHAHRPAATTSTHPASP